MHHQPTIAHDRPDFPRQDWLRCDERSWRLLSCLLYHSHGLGPQRPWHGMSLLPTPSNISTTSPSRSHKEMLDIHHRPRQRNRLRRHLPAYTTRRRQRPRRANRRLGQDLALPRFRQPAALDRARKGRDPSSAGCRRQRPLGPMGEDPG